MYAAMWCDERSLKLKFTANLTARRAPPSHDFSPPPRQNPRDSQHGSPCHTTWSPDDVENHSSWPIQPWLDNTSPRCIDRDAGHGHPPLLARLSSPWSSSPPLLCSFELLQPASGAFTAPILVMQIHGCGLQGRGCCIESVSAAKKNLLL